MELGRYRIREDLHRIIFMIFSCSQVHDRNVGVEQLQSPGKLTHHDLHQAVIIQVGHRSRRTPTQT